MHAVKASEKIQAPLVPPTIVHREHLSRILGKALGSSEDTKASTPYSFVLLCAPAGYGKTTLLADTVQRYALPCCWYFLDHSDRSGMLFLETLLASIRQRFPDFGPHLDTLLAENLQRDGPVSARVLDALLGVLASDIPERCILALCNYQEVNESPAIKEIVSHLLRYLPQQCRLVIESRARPDLDLAPLMTSRKMFGLSSRGLQFSAQELYALAQVQDLPALSEEEAARLVATFDGWITGILLGSRFGSTQFESFTPGERTTSTLHANRHQLFSFVVTEAFRNEEEMYTFLKDTSFLERLLPSFCDFLLEVSNSAALLERAERQGLFVTRIDEDEGLVYVCQSIICELFQEELCSHESDRYRALLRRAAMFCYQHYEYETALRYAFDGQAYDLAASIILEAAPTLFNQGQSEIVLRYLDRFPPRFVQENDQLLLLRANTSLRRGDFASARLFLECAEAQAILTASPPANGNIEQKLTLAGFAIAHGKLLLHQGEHALALEQLQRALALLPIDERLLRIQAHQQLGICFILSGRPVHEGIAQFQQALHLCRPQIDARLAGELHHQLANAYEWTGDYTIAEHHRRRISAIQERLGQPQSIINNLTGMGLLKMRQGYVEEAQACFQHILSLTHQSPRFLSSEAYALLGFGELELTRQRFQPALTCLERALDLAHQLEDRYLLNSILNKLALVYLRMGDVHTAHYLLDQMVLRADETRSYESISYTLVKGTILLAQQCYDEARVLFEEVLRLTNEITIPWIHSQALVRLAACYLAQGQRTQAKQLLQKELASYTKEDLDYSLQVELQVYPALQALTQDAIEPDVHPDRQILSTKRLSIYALGEPTVLIGNMPVTRWRMARAMELYFFLLENKQPLRKDQIIAALWPEAEDIGRINQTFRSTIYYVRQAIGETCLVQRSGQYRLDLQAVYGQVWYDVAAFDEQQRLAKRALEEQDDESAAQAFQKMIDLYRGDYVEAFYSDWCIPRRNKLRAAFMEAHHQLALIAWRRERWDESLQHWQHLLTLDPCLEMAHYGVMRCYLRQGKRDLALRQYQRCSRELHEQLKAQPGPSLQKLYQRLISTSAYQGE